MRSFSYINSPVSLPLQPSWQDHLFNHHIYLSAQYGLYWAWEPFSGSCKLLLEAKCEKNTALKDPVVAIAAYQFGAAAVLWFKKRRRWNSEQDLSLLATRIRARCPIHKTLFFSEASATAQDRPGDLVTVVICPFLFFISTSEFLLWMPFGFPLF